MSRPRVVPLALGLVFILGAGGASAATLYVGAKQKYTTIQAAINAAATGDVVVVAEGTYTENINFLGKAITVCSTNPTSGAVVAKTIINGNQKGSVVAFDHGEGRSSVLAGFTLTNGSGTNCGGGATCGGGVLAYGTSPTVAHCVITYNSAHYGGGVDAGPQMVLRNDTISGNSATYGGGVDCDAYTLLKNDTISGNSATYGGGVDCDAYTLLKNDTISDNSAGDGGGIFCQKVQPTLVGDVLSDNHAKQGGGVYCYSSRPTIKNTVISANSTSGHGGGVYLDDQSNAYLINDTVSDNSAPPAYGGGMYADFASSPVLRNSIVAENKSGGGLVNGADQDGTTPQVSYSDLYGNAGGNYLKFPIQTGKNGNLSVPPRFANASMGNFYLDSKYGRWAPAKNAWVIDTVQSPCIDAGDPKSPYNLEPAPNGGRINMGFEGDTSYASKSPTATSAATALTVTAAAVATTGGSAQIVVTLASAASVEATIVNIAGREIAVLPAQDLAAGVSTMRWDGRSALGTRVPEGRYLVRVTARTPDGGQAQALVALELRR